MDWLLRRQSSREEREGSSQATEGTPPAAVGQLLGCEQHRVQLRAVREQWSETKSDVSEHTLHALAIRIGAIRGGVGAVHPLAAGELAEQKPLTLRVQQTRGYAEIRRSDVDSA
mmetsp:Transcript_30908/g.42489  ORF Transcript_30908/g.42489 Transcript_30908/m.42489 type:complete len:114 (-) Transcript_30908:2398-2739(-)